MIMVPDSTGIDILPDNTGYHYVPDTGYPVEPDTQILAGYPVQPYFRYIPTSNDHFNCLNVL